MLPVVVLASAALLNLNTWKKDKLKCHYIYNSTTGGGRRGLSGTEKLHKKSPKTAKPQGISSKTENQIKLLTHKALRLQNLLLTFVRVNLFYFLRFFLVIVSAEHITSLKNSFFM